MVAKVYPNRRLPQSQSIYAYHSYSSEAHKCPKALIVIDRQGNGQLVSVANFEVSFLCTKPFNSQ